MAGRALWKGVLSLGVAQVPVKLYTAQRDNSLHFHLLHDKDKARLNQVMVCELCDQVVDIDNQVKGYQVGEDRYVVFDKKELAELEPEADRVIEIEEFVREEEIDFRYFGRAYYLGPDGNTTAYLALAKAMQNTGRVGICRWVMRKKSYAGTVRLAGNVLQLVTMRYRGEVIAVDTLNLSKPPITEKELRTARYLIEELAADFDPAVYQNEYRKKLRALINKKANGKAVKLAIPRKRRRTEPDRLLQVLEKSLQHARSGKMK